MRIVILGQNRSGTTALFHLLRDSWQAADADPVLRFEPREIDPAMRSPEADVLAKILFVPGIFQPDAFAEFERCILVTRDPRDVLVSHLLYSLRNTALVREPDRAAVFLEALGRKETEPATVSLRSLFELLFELDPDVDFDRYLERIRFATEWDATGWFRLRYEDFVDGEREDLERYVGFRLLPEATVDPGLRRVERTKAHGLWQHWFTAEDLAFFADDLDPYCERWGYDVRTMPARNPRIDPAHATGYVGRMLADPDPSAVARE